jgi:hypothetical protein
MMYENNTKQKRAGYRYIAGTERTFSHSIK